MIASPQILFGELFSFLAGKSTSILRTFYNSSQFLKYKEKKTSPREHKEAEQKQGLTLIYGGPKYPQLNPLPKRWLMMMMMMKYTFSIYERFKNIKDEFLEALQH